MAIGLSKKNIKQKLEKNSLVDKLKNMISSTASKVGRALVSLLSLVFIALS